MKLNGHVDIIRGVSYKPSDVVSSLDANSVGILRANNIANGEINTNEMVYVDQSRVSDAQRIRIGDIIVCASSGSQSLVGKAAINKNLTREYAHGAFCLLIRCNNTILPKYLNIYLQTALYRNQIESLSCGSNILNIKADHLTSLDIPIPDIKQQSDFVTIIEQADKSKFVGFKSQFIEMFEGDKYPSVKLSDIASEWLKGQSFRKDDIVDNGNSTCIHYGELFTKYGPIINQVLSRTNVEGKRTSKVGDILFPASDVTPNGLARCSMLPYDNIILGGDIIVLRPKRDCNAAYLSYAINQQTAQLLIRVNGAVVKHLSAKALMTVVIPMPPLEEQNRFVSLAQQADKSKFELRQAIEKIDKVMKSLLQ